MSSVRQLARIFSDIVETNALWRRMGRRWFVPRLELLPPGGDEQQRWRQIYGDFSGRNNIERTVAHMWLAVAGHRARGGLILSPISGGHLLHTMRVPRPYRGLGIGTWLLEGVLQWAGKEKQTLWLQVRPENRPAVVLYKHHGFEPIDPPAALRREGHLVMRWDEGAGVVPTPTTPSASQDSRRPSPHHRSE